MQLNHDDIQEFNELHRRELTEQVDAVVEAGHNNPAPRSNGPPIRQGLNPLSPATVEDLRNILKEDYGRDITPEQASEIAHTLVRYFDLLMEMYHRERSSGDRDK